MAEPIFLDVISLKISVNGLKIKINFIFNQKKRLNWRWTVT